MGSIINSLKKASSCSSSCLIKTITSDNSKHWKSGTSFPLFMNPTFHYHVHYSPPSDCVLSHTNKVHLIIARIFEINFSTGSISHRPPQHGTAGGNIGRYATTMTSAPRQAVLWFKKTLSVFSSHLPLDLPSGPFTSCFPTKFCILFHVSHTPYMNYTLTLEA